MAKSTANYGNDSIRQLKDEERVRLRPAVIFGSDGLDGCAHAAFEILSNSVDEARQGFGKLITTGSRTAVTGDAAQPFLYFVNRHALYQFWDRLQVSVTATVEFYMFDDVAI